MSKEIKVLENTPEKAVYQFGEGKKSLVLSVAEVEYSFEGLNPNEDPFSCLEKHLRLDISNKGKSLYSLSEVENVKMSLAPELNKDRVYVIKNLSKKLYNDKSDKALKTRKLLSMISGNPLIDEINKQMVSIEDSQNEALNNSKVAKIRKKIAHDIDETFGTNLEEKKLSNFLKRKVEEPLSRIVEKMLSNKKTKD